MDSTLRGCTDIGRLREGNEDAFLVDAELHLAIVADGMGGHACGEVASQLCTRVFQHVVKRHADLVERYESKTSSVEPAELLALMKAGMLSACRAIFREAEKDPGKAGMGTTCSALLLAGDAAFIAHVGDSRIYLVRDGAAIQLTRDHSLLNELVDRGRLSPDQATDAAYASYRNALSRAVGVSPSVEVDLLAVEVLPGDTFFLASDGLHHYVGLDELPHAAGLEIGTLPHALVELANERGGHDNITSVVVQLAPAAPGEDRRSDEFVRKVTAFRKVPIFKDLEYAHLLHVLTLARARTAQTGEVVVRQGDRGDALFVVLDGRVQLSRDGSNIIELGKGEHFGELALIDDSPHSMTVTVKEPSRLMRLTRNDLAEIVGRQPNIALRLLWSLAEVVARRLRHTTEEMIAMRILDKASTTPIQP